MVLKPVSLGHSRPESECWKLIFFTGIRYHLKKCVWQGYSCLKDRGISRENEKNINFGSQKMSFGKVTATKMLLTWKLDLMKMSRDSFDNCGKHS